MKCECPFFYPNLGSFFNPQDGDVDSPPGRWIGPFFSLNLEARSIFCEPKGKTGIANRFLCSFFFLVYCPPKCREVSGRHPPAADDPPHMPLHPRYEPTISLRPAKLFSQTPSFFTPCGLPSRGCPTSKRPSPNPTLLFRPICSQVVQRTRNPRAVCATTRC